jgi:hypothetical protein
MDEDDKKRIAELNAEADAKADKLIDWVKGSPYSWAVLLGFGVICFLLGRWSV